MTIFSLPSSNGGSQSVPPPSTDTGTKDGSGCADHDQPYRFGRRPKAAAPFPFSARQFAHLLALRGRVADGLAGRDDLDQTGIVCPGCACDGDRDDVARVILSTAGVLG